MNTNTIIIIWATLGLINILILYIIDKTHPQILRPKIPPGQIPQAILLIIWFALAFIIIPIYLIKFLRIYLLKKLNDYNDKLNHIINKIQRKK